jgi:3-oxoacyl-[acyl-carrier-protein] synthase II
LNRSVNITGFGVISAIGINSHENLAALKQNKHGISSLQNFESMLKDQILVGEVKLSSAELKEKAALQNVQSNSRGALMGIIAVKEAIAHAELSAEDLKTTALISGTSVGGMDLFEQGFGKVMDEKIENPSLYFIEHDCGNINLKIASETGIKGYISTISTACSSSANALLLGARMIKAGLIDRAIVGGSDALSKFTVNGFNALGILDGKHSSPFDIDRNGLNLGEGAAYLVLEAGDICKDKVIHAELKGYGNSNDAFHQTASSAEGIGSKLAIEKALRIAGIKADEIDYVNTHGTGTGNNDLSESQSMLQIFGANRIPKFNSLKPFTGHTLAACGSIEAIYSIFSLNHKVLFPSLNFKTPIKETKLIPILKREENQKVNTVLSNSFGFGGNCTSLIFTKN